jgi:acyl carrier protein
VRGALETGSRVRAVVAKALLVDPDQIRDEALLVDDLGVSSLDRFELIMDLEAEFGVEIREDDLVGAKTVSDIVRCIDAQINGPMSPQGA